MRVTQIINPGAVWGNSPTIDDQLVAEYQNLPAGATRSVGDVVILPASDTPATGTALPQVTTTTTVNDKSVVGVVGEANLGNVDQPSVGGGAAGGSPTSSTRTYAAGAVLPVVVRGWGRIQIAANTVARLDTLTTSAAAGVAATNAGDPVANAVGGSLIGIALEASTQVDANGTIRAYIMKF